MSGVNVAIEIDIAKCDGYASCILLAPEVFDFDETRNIAVVKASLPEQLDLTEIDEAIRNCPRRAITRV
ncbi:ferredoxin [Microtetraspora malaysiensis]|uniref:ferredoxin n=1 Tax=Microtetraspora malaysiensis TaxID=161358 RepID=UPI003D8BA064